MLASSIDIYLPSFPGAVVFLRHHVQQFLPGYTKPRGLKDHGSHKALGEIPLALLLQQGPRALGHKHTHAALLIGDPLVHQEIYTL